jgi:hypothetical protein
VDRYRGEAAVQTLKRPAPVLGNHLPFSPGQISSLIERFFTELGRPVRKNLTLLVAAFLHLTAALRSGNGELTLAAVARTLPLPHSFKARYKRLNRFLDNRLFDPQGLTEGLFALLLGMGAARGLVPVICDQSALGAAQLLVAGIPLAGRILPLAVTTFTYADIQNRPLREKSQNFIEHILFTRLLEASPPGITLCFILDRGYARVDLLRLLLQQQAPFILRVKRNVVVQGGQGEDHWRCRVGALPAPHGQVRRLERIRYHAQKPIELDLIIYGEQGFQEPWYLAVPAGSAHWLPTAEVVELYRRRMHVEQGFRDFKTHLGLRGLRLEVRIAPRVERLLMAFTLAYALVVVLGMTEVAERARERLEDARPRGRHGTTRILSARTVGALLLGGFCAELTAAVIATFAWLITWILKGAGLYCLALRL